MIPMKDLRLLGPFALSTFMYVVCNRPHAEVSSLACLIKAAPILSLAYFVWARGVLVASRRNFAKYVFVALLFSALGDTLIQLKDHGYFLHGMAAFALSQALFIFAFGTTPVDILVGIPINGLGLAYYVFLHSHPRVANDQPFAIALAVYSLVICTMLWRALTRWRFEAAGKGKNSRRPRWLLVGFLGAASFVVSDSSLAWWMVVGDYKHSELLIMGTYYLAQLLISLSILHEDPRGGGSRKASTATGSGGNGGGGSSGNGGGGSGGSGQTKTRFNSASRRKSSDREATRPFDSFDANFRMYDKVTYTGK